MIARDRRVVLHGAAFMACLVSLAGAAEEPGITVIGTGEVLAKPNLLEIEVRASAEAELTGDAVVKYGDTLRRIRGAFAKLQMKELTVEERELNIASGAEAAGGLAAVMVGQNKTTAKANVHITRSLRLSVHNIEKLPEADVIATISKLLDTAKDSGATVGKEGNAALLQMMGRGDGPSSVVHFVVEYGIETAGSDDARLSSDKLIDIPVRVTLRVRFAIDNATPEKGH